MSGSDPRPPRWAEGLLRRTLPPGVVGDSIVGDLREEMARHVRKGGRFPRARWLARAASVAVGYGMRRAGPGPSARGAFRETRRAARSLLGRPGSTAAAVLVLALGIGLATFMFSVAYGLWYRDPGVPRGSELRVATLTDAGRREERGVPPDVFREWSADAPGFRELAGLRTGPVALAGPEGPAELRQAAWMTPDAFAVLEVEPALGRTFHEDEAASGSPVAVLAWELWQARTGGDPEALGSSLRVDGRTVTVVGVMPRGFGFPSRQELWMPLEPDGSGGPPGAGLRAFGRLDDRTDADAARRALEAVATRTRRAAGTGEGEPLRARVVRFNELGAGDALAPVLAGMMAAALLVLVVACANVGGVLAAGAAARLQEVGVRTALGSGRRRSAVPFLAESLVLATAGALLGTVGAVLATGAFDRYASALGKPPWMEVQVDAPILAFVVGVALVVTVLAGVAPVLLALRNDVAALLRSRARGVAGATAARAGRALVVTQVTLSCALLVGSGLVGRSLLRLADLDYPFAREDVLTARVRPLPDAAPDPAARAAFYDELLRELESAPGVAAAGLASGVPSFAPDLTAVRPEDGNDLPEAAGRRAFRAALTPGTLELWATPPVRGRGVEASDREDAPSVAVVEEEMARALFGDADPLGRRFTERAGDGGERSLTVVGVTGELRLEGITNLDRGLSYVVPLAQADPPGVYLLVQGSAAPDALAAGLRETVRALDADLPVTDVKSLRAVVEESNWFFHVFGGIFASFGVAGLLMAAVGLYGVLGFAVARRVPELGIRIAIGAGSGRIGRLVARDAAAQVGTGVAGGLVLAWLAGPLLRGLLFQVDPRDPLVYASVVALVCGAAAVAAAAPTLRAIRVDPVDALRAE